MFTFEEKSCDFGGEGQFKFTSDDVTIDKIRKEISLMKSYFSKYEFWGGDPPISKPFFNHIIKNVEGFGGLNESDFEKFAGTAEEWEHGSDYNKGVRWLIHSVAKCYNFHSELRSELAPLIDIIVRLKIRVKIKDVRWDGAGSLSEVTEGWVLVDNINLPLIGDFGARITDIDYILN